MQYDIFIYHANEDKDEFVRPLADELRKYVRVWYDEFSLQTGDSIRQSIDRGLIESDYGVVVLSPHFFRKTWTQRELDGLFARETNDRKVILPIWHKVSFEDVKNYSPPLSLRHAEKSADGLDKVVEALLQVIKPAMFSLAKIAEEKTWGELSEGCVPFTLGNLLEYVKQLDATFPWEKYILEVYSAGRRNYVSNMAQFAEAISNREAQGTLSEVYRRMLSKKPNWLGKAVYLPCILMEGQRGVALVEQAILMSAEFNRQG